MPPCNYAKICVVIAAILLSHSCSQTLAQCVEQQKLTAFDAASDDEFGRCISVSGNTTIVGAFSADCSAGPNCGAVYIYRFNGGLWIKQQKITASDEKAHAAFGASVSISHGTLVVGAPAVDCLAGVDCGAAYIFRFNGTSWVEQEKIVASDMNQRDLFGVSVSIDQDTVVVGARQDNCAAGLFCGGAYVFRFNGTNWFEQQKLAPTDAEAFGLFGQSVSISGNTVVAGSSFSLCAGSSCGSAYVFRFDGTRWLQQQKLTASNIEIGDGFGVSVSVHGNTVLVGADGTDCATGHECGAAYMFHFNGTRWLQQQKLVAPETKSDKGFDDNFGHSVSVNGSTAIVGSYGGNCLTIDDCGLTCVFRFNGTNWVRAQILTASDAENRAFFGYSISVSGDVVAIGAWKSDCVAGSDCGSAYMFNIGSGSIDLDCDNDIDLFNFATFQALFTGDLSTFAAFQISFTGPQ